MLVAMITYRQLFANGEFRALFASNAANIAGGTMAMLALATLVYAQTGSPLLAALAYLGGFLPQALGAATLLSLADRVPPRAFLVGWHASRVALALVLASGLLPVWAMLALVMAAGTVQAVAGAVNLATVVDVVPAGGYVLGRSVLNVSVGAMQIAGFAAGGLLVASYGPHATLLGSAALSLVTALLIRFGLRARAPQVTGRASVGASWHGNRQLLGDPALRVLLLAQWVPNGLVVGAEALYVPYAGQAAGAMFAAAAFGMLAGDVVVGRWVPPVWRSRLIVPLYLLLAIPYLAFVWRPSGWLAAALVGVASFGFASHLGLQERYLDALPDRLRGQGLGLASSGMQTGQAVAATLTGALAEAFAPGLVMAAAAVASLAVTAALVRPLRRSRTAVGPGVVGEPVPTTVPHNS